MDVFLYETTGTDDAGDPVAIRLTSGQGYNHPSAPGFFEGRMLAASDASAGLSVQRSVFDGGRFGGGDLAYGVVEAANPDGALDSWLDLGFGLDATLKLGEEEATYGSFTTVLKARASQVIVSDQALTFGWQSRMTELDLPACPATFAGTNSGTTGLEGTADDIKGNPKPWAMGVLKGITPVVLNGSTRILGWNFDTDGSRLPTDSIDAVKYQGALWTAGTDYPNAAALAASTASTGIYNTCLAESLILMGGSASLNGKITLDVTIEATASARYAGSLWKACLLRAGVSSGDISAADMTALNTAAPYQAGYYAQGENYREVADKLAASIAACYAPDRLGVYRIRQMTAPSGTPVASFKRLELDSVQGPDEGDLMQVVPIGSDWTPVKQVRVAYARNWTPLTPNEVASAVSADDQAFLTAAWRYTDPADDSDVATKYGNALTRDFETYLASEADAEAIRDVLLALFGAQRREYQATVSYGTAFAALLELGAVIRVTHPKYGMSAGVLAAIHGIRLRDTTEVAELKLWF
ncbi:MAG: hypothetical protein AB7F35_00550 [Acetobacteraceae bacterium]